MRLLVTEFFCSGAAVDSDEENSLFPEGKAMLQAIAADLVQIPDVQVVTLLSSQLPSWNGPAVEAITIDDREHFEQQFRRLAGACDAVYAIAPETGGVLESQCRRVEEAGGRFLGASVDAIANCSDKLRLSRRVAQSGVLTIPTESIVSHTSLPTDWSFPVVVKPNDGAGTCDTFLIRDQEQLESVSEFAAGREMIVQPYVAGLPCSVVAIIGEQIDLWPTALQQIDVAHRFRYRGGQLPFESTDATAVAEMVRTVCHILSGLRGYVGFDFIQPAEDGRPVLVEINPRLTTSYLGYRAATDENLAERILFPGRASRPATWRNGPVSFTADGEVGTGRTK